MYIKLNKLFIYAINYYILCNIIMSKLDILDINDITNIEDELNKFIKNYKNNLEKIKHDGEDSKVLKHTTSQTKLKLQQKLEKIVEQNAIEKNY